MATEPANRLKARATAANATSILRRRACWTRGTTLGTLRRLPACDFGWVRVVGGDHAHQCLCIQDGWVKGDDEVCGPAIEADLAHTRLLAQEIGQDTGQRRLFAQGRYGEAHPAAHAMDEGALGKWPFFCLGRRCGAAALAEFQPAEFQPAEFQLEQLCLGWPHFGLAGRAVPPESPRATPARRHT